MKKLFVFIILILLSGCDNPPEIEIDMNLNNGIDILTVGEAHIDTGCVISIGDNEFDMLASDNYDNTTNVGDYVITYSYTYEKEVYTCIRYIMFIDDVSPTVLLNPGIDTIKVGEDFVDAGVTYSDNHSLNCSLFVSGEVDTSEAGTYAIIYVVEDSALNITEIVRIVHVID